MAYTPRMMKKDEFAALETLIAYNYTDEERHWIESGKPDEGHVFNSIRTLLEYADKCNGK